MHPPARARPRPRPLITARPPATSFGSPWPRDTVDPSQDARGGEGEGGKGGASREEETDGRREAEEHGKGRKTGMNRRT